MPRELILAVVAALVAGLSAWRTGGGLRGTVRPARAAPPQRLTVDPAVACDLVAVVIASGASVPNTLDALGAATGEEELRVAGRLLRLGAPWSEAVVDVPGSWQHVLDPLRGAWRDGVDPTAALAVAAAGWRAQRAAHAREEAERLAVRLVLPLGLFLLPAFVLLGLVPVVLSVGSGLVQW